MNTSNSQAAVTAKTTKYSDFTRAVSDFFSRDFTTGQVRLEAKTSAKAPFGLFSKTNETFSDEFKMVATRDVATGSIAAEVKSTCNVSLYRDRMDCKSTTTLASSNLLTQQLTFNNVVIDGLKLDMTGTLQPVDGNNAKVSVDFAQPSVYLASSLDVFRGPALCAEAATRFRDFQIGAEVGYDVGKGQIDKYSAAVAFDRPREKIVLQALKGFSTFDASYFQKFNDQVEVAYRASWSAKTSSSLLMEVGAKYNLVGGGGFIKAKLNTAGCLGVALASDLRTGVQLTLGASIDTTKLAENNHKIGMSLTYSA